MSIRVQRALAWGLALLCAAVILGFSSQEGESSEGLSFRVTAFFLRVLNGAEPDQSSAEFLRDVYVVRKIAHVCEYTAFALALVWALWTVGARGVLRYALLYAVCLTLAFADEWRQTLVPGRYGCFKDVAVDQIGTVLAAMLSLAWFSLRRARKAKRRSL